MIEDDAFCQEYLGFADGTYPMWKCRVLLTNLLADSWRHVSATKDFLRLGLRTGCVMPKAEVDRSELSPIVIDGFNGTYKFDHVNIGMLDQDASVPIETAPAQTSSVVLSSPDPIEPEPFSNVASAFEINDNNAVKSDDHSSEEDEESDSEGDPGDDHDEGESEESEDGRHESRSLESEDDIDDDDRIDFDDKAIEAAFADDTQDPSLPFPSSRDGFTIEPCIEKMPKMSELVGKRVLWALPVCKDGNPGWVMCEVFGGPPDPASAAQGITVQLRCSSRFDKNTPGFLLKDRANASFQLQNYGVVWLLLKRASG